MSSWKGSEEFRGGGGSDLDPVQPISQIRGGLKCPLTAGGH